MQLQTSANGYYPDNPQVKNRLVKVKQFGSRKKIDNIWKNINVSVEGKKKTFHLVSKINNNNNTKNINGIWLLEAKQMGVSVLRVYDGRTVHF